MWLTFLITRRILIFGLQIIGITVVLFALAEFYPGLHIGGTVNPWYVRYFWWASNILRGNFGTVQGIPVTTLVAERLGNTLFLSTLTITIVYSFAIPLGYIAGRYKGKPPERVISIVNFIQLTIPAYIFALVLQWVFAIHLGVLPLRGSVSVLVVGGDFIEVLISRFQHAILPAFSMAMLAGSGILQFLANEINDQKSFDYPLTAMSKGVPATNVYKKHIFRNSILPLCTDLGTTIAGIFSGSIIIEQMFTFNGLGNFFVSAAMSGNWTIVTFMVMFYSTVTLFGFLVSDILLTIFDPRIQVR
ncbi:MAG: ABC transporter permease [Defluviitaleaceae bacterium]|nr:ABC transporter permease [Defluviitaleaceae bacterium]